MWLFPKHAALLIGLVPIIKERKEGKSVKRIGIYLMKLNNNSKNILHNILNGGSGVSGQQAP